MIFFATNFDLEPGEAAIIANRNIIDFCGRKEKRKRNSQWPMIENIIAGLCL
jgi:hypothetical protein